MPIKHFLHLVQEPREDMLGTPRGVVSKSAEIKNSSAARQAKYPSCAPA
jgi:hypothetical protein